MATNSFNGIKVVFNSLTPGRGGNNFEIIIFELIFLIDILRDSYEIVLWRMLKQQFHEKSTLVQVMAWCGQAARQYLSQYWPRYLLTYEIWWHQATNLSFPEMIYHPILFSASSYFHTILSSFLGTSQWTEHILLLCLHITYKQMGVLSSFLAYCSCKRHLLACRKPCCNLPTSCAMPSSNTDIWPEKYFRTLNVKVYSQLETITHWAWFV